MMRQRFHLGPMTQPSPPAALPANHLDAAMSAGTDMSRLQDASLLRALTWWRGLPCESLAAGVMLPDRSRIDPVAIPDLLPHLVLWEVLHQTDGSLRYRCRLAGTAMVEIHGYEFTGLTMEEFHGAENARIQPEYDFVARNGRPHYVERSLFWMNRDYRRYRRLLLPFGDVSTMRDGVAKILNVAHFLTE